MVRITLILIQLFIICGYSFAVPLEPQKSTAAYSPDVNQADNPQKEDIGVNESTAPYSLGGVKISASLRKKILELETIAAQEPGQDNSASERLAGKIWLKIIPIWFNDEFVEVLADKEVDWRVRDSLINVKRRFVSDRKIGKYLPAFKNMLLDNSEHPKVRGSVAMLIGELAQTNQEVKALLTAVAADSGNPPEVVEPAMAVLGSVGVDDVDRLLEIMNRKQKGINGLGVSLNAIRALCESKNPKAPDLLIRIFNESAPDSFFNATAIEELGCLFNTAERRKQFEPLVVPQLLKMLDDRSDRGASRIRAAELLVHIKAKGIYEPIARWFLPSDKSGAPKAGGGGNYRDVTFGARYIADICDKRGIPVLDGALKNFATDPRFSWSKEPDIKRGIKFPEEVPDYIEIKQQLKRLRDCKPE